MRIAVTGSSGLIGSALCDALRAEGDEVVRLVRREARADDEAGYDPEREFNDPDRVEGCRAVVHLAGESMTGERWSGEKERAIRHSRYEGTRKLCQNVSQLDELPEVIVIAVSLGFYGDRRDEVLTEGSARGQGPVAEFGEDWEAAAEMVEAVGMRLVIARLGLVLSARGGLLPAQVAALRGGRAGEIGTGQQWLSWVHEEDAVAGVRHAIATPSLAGPLNLVAPGPVRQRDFAATLARVLGVDRGAPLDSEGARAVFGDVAGELLLPSRRAEPRALAASGFVFRHPELEGALRSLVG